MSNSPSTIEKSGFDQKMLSALRLGAVFLAVYLCYQILAPFISLVLWGAIIAVAIYPLHQKLAAGIGGRVNISATLITSLGLIILILPLVVLTESLMASIMSLAEGISTGAVRAPPPPEGQANSSMRATKKTEKESRMPKVTSSVKLETPMINQP